MPGDDQVVGLPRFLHMEAFVPREVMYVYNLQVNFQSPKFEPRYTFLPDLLQMPTRSALAQSKALSDYGQTGERRCAMPPRVLLSCSGRKKKELYVRCPAPKIRVHYDLHNPLPYVKDQPNEPPTFRVDPCQMDSTARLDLQPRNQLHMGLRSTNGACSTGRKR